MRAQSLGVKLKNRRILGLDPGSRFTGFGLVDLTPQGRLLHVDHGVIKIPEKFTFSDKLNFLRLQLENLHQKYAPQDMVIEKIFLGKNVDSVFKLGHVRGVAMATASSFRCEVTEYAARSAKKIVTGSGAASKEHVRLLVLNLLGIGSDSLLDATDALSLAICHSRKIEELSVLKRLEMSAR